MGRLARVVLPGVVHHVTQRGVRSMDIFYKENDRKDYINLLAERGRKVGLEFVGYCLMTNHVHLLVVPSDEDSLRKGIGEAHRLYTQRVNNRLNTRGHLFQARFYSCPLDSSHFLAAARYIERNPVRGKLCNRAEDYPWSSARFHLGITKTDPLIVKKIESLPSEDEWSNWLEIESPEIDMLRHHFRVGRPLGDEAFIKQAELTTGRGLRRKKAGRPTLKSQSSVNI